MLVPFIDIESDGLDEHKNWLLEVGVVVADMPSGEEICNFSTCLYVPPEMIPGIREGCTDKVRKMHDASGLWVDLLDPAKCTERKDLDAWLCTIAEIWAPSGTRADDLPTLTNFNAPFDWRWLKQYAPRFVAEKLHYRVFDLSTLRTSVSMVYPAGFGPQKGAEHHRGVDDAREALEYWRWYRAHVMTPYGRGLELTAGGAQ